MEMSRVGSDPGELDEAAVRHVETLAPGVHAGIAADAVVVVAAAVVHDRCQSRVQKIYLFAEGRDSADFPSCCVAPRKHRGPVDQEVLVEVQKSADKAEGETKFRASHDRVDSASRCEPDLRGHPTAAAGTHETNSRGRTTSRTMDEGLQAV